MRSDYDDNASGTVVLVGVGEVGISVASELAAERPGVPLIQVDLVGVPVVDTQPLPSTSVRLDAAEMERWDCTVPESLDALFAVGPLRRLVDALPPVDPVHSVFVCSAEDHASVALGMLCRATATRGHVSSILVTPSRGETSDARLRSLRLVEDVDMNVHFFRWLPQRALPDETLAEGQRRSRHDLRRAAERCVAEAIDHPMPDLLPAMDPVEATLDYAGAARDVPASFVWSYLARAARCGDQRGRSESYARVAKAIARAYGLEPRLAECPLSAIELFDVQPEHRRAVEALWRARECVASGPVALSGWMEGHPFLPRGMEAGLPDHAGRRVRHAADLAVKALQYCVGELYELDDALFEACGLEPADVRVTVADLWRIDPGTRAVVGM